MTAFPVTSLFAGLLGVLLLLLSLLVIRARMKARTSFGFGEDPRLLRAIRAQANFVEYAPMTLLLLLLLEASGTAPGLLYILGGATMGGRILHALGISPEPERLILRQLGMLLTFGALGFSAGLLLFNLWA
ncbi:MAPEG family protein [Roseococcus sp.]|uniref:MAPEG family protein n=1 Tax=Roseococcus sp. TaxID=2109646 RepID=UPI003BA9E0B5